ncbi:MAG: hypothetical protein HZY73_13745 [Micropruina sp.]|nr:MAG: hypothetical protein HZY73_13745 [Micropruina sp.]
MRNWPRRVAFQLRAARRAGRALRAIRGKPNPTGSGTYTVTNLPEVTYEKQGRTLTLAFADLTAPAGNSLVTTLEPNPAGSTDYFADVRLPKVDERLGDPARTHRYVMAASVLTEYHRKA